jgi:hypothetical protein
MYGYGTYEPNGLDYRADGCVGLDSFSVACELVKLQQVSVDRVGRGQNLKHRAGRTSKVGCRVGSLWGGFPLWFRMMGGSFATPSRTLEGSLCGMVVARGHMHEAVGMRFAGGHVDDREGSKHMEVLGAAGPSGWLGSHVQEGRTTSEFACWQ